MEDRFRGIAEKVVEINFADVRWAENILLLESFDRFDAASPDVRLMRSDSDSTYSDVLESR